jgi:hypothetical protein
VWNDPRHLFFACLLTLVDLNIHACVWYIQFLLMKCHFLLNHLVFFQGTTFCFFKMGSSVFIASLWFIMAKSHHYLLQKWYRLGINTICPIITENVINRLVWWTSIVENCSKIIEYLVDGVGGALLWKVFSQITQIHFFQELYPPFYTFVWVKLVHLL